MAARFYWQGQPVHIRTPRDSAGLGIETVYQDLALCNNLDIVQNMFLGREPTCRGVMDENAMESAAVSTLTSLSVTTVRSVRQVVASLSGGQRQAVAVAKAVMWNSKLVIMDEPTAALGVAQTAMVLALTRRLAERGLGVIFVSHNFNDVFEVADQIAVLYLGRLVASIPAADLDRQMVVDLVTTGTTTRDVPGQTLSERSLTMAQETGLNPPSGGGVAAQVPPGEEGSPSGQQGSVVALGAYLRTYVARVRSGDSGVLPVVGGLLAISIIFQIGNSHFLTAENLVNLLQQGSIYMVMAMGIVFVLLLGEIDLSVGYVGLVGGAIAAEMLSANHPLALVVVTALAATAAIGFLQGLLITRLGLPSFVVTLAGLLGWRACSCSSSATAALSPSMTTTSTTSPAATSRTWP